MCQPLHARTGAIGLALLAAALAGPSFAAPAASPERVQAQVADALTAAIFAPAAHEPLPVVYRQARPALPPGVARTAVEHRSRGDAVVSAAGLLCGMTPVADARGAASMTGYDPHGRFVGARLAFAF
jgi:hypothetical protein